MCIRDSTYFALELCIFPGDVFLHLLTEITCREPFLLLFNSVIESILIIFIFFFNNFDLAKNRFGSPTTRIGILKFSNALFDASLIIKSGPMPAGSPGE